MSRLDDIDKRVSEHVEPVTFCPNTCTAKIEAADLRYLLAVARAADDLCEATGGWRLPTTVGGSRFGPSLMALRAAIDGSESGAP